MNTRKKLFLLVGMAMFVQSIHAEEETRKVVPRQKPSVFKRCLLAAQCASAGATSCILSVCGLKVTEDGLRSVAEEQEMSSRVMNGFLRGCLSLGFVVAAYYSFNYSRKTYNALSSP